MVPIGIEIKRAEQVDDLSLPMALDIFLKGRVDRGFLCAVLSDPLGFMNQLIIQIEVGRQNPCPSIRCVKYYTSYCVAMRESDSPFIRLLGVC